MLTSSALDADGSSDRGLLVDYASMPGALEAYVFPKHFGLSLAPEDALRTHAASSVYSKARGGRKAGAWESDNEKTSGPRRRRSRAPRPRIYSRRLSGRVKRRCRGRAATTSCTSATSHLKNYM